MVTHMIRAVTLDFWNTLMDDFHLPSRHELRTLRLREIVAPYGYTPDPDAVEAAFDEVWRHFDRIWLKKKRTPTTAESVTVLLHTLRIRLHEPVVKQIVTMLEEVTLDCPPRTVAGVAETLPVLAERYALAVVCDAALTPGRVLREVLALHGLERFFSAFFFSDEHGWSKPDARAFLTPLALLDVAPSEAVHVGDIQRTDIAGAQAAGLRAVHFVGVNSSDLTGSTADAVAHRFDELPAVIARLG
jgi:putative hydrolase of the HAD superfamily